MLPILLAARLALAATLLAQHAMHGDARADG
jgi:hypothetical protein